MKTFEIQSPTNKRLRLPFPTFEEAVKSVVAGYEILAEYDECLSTPGEYSDSPPVYSGGTLAALIGRENPKDPTSRYVRTDVSKARPARLDGELVAFLQAEIDAGRLRTRRTKA